MPDNTLCSLFAACVVALCANVAAIAADQSAPVPEIIEESHGPIPAIPCTSSNCGTVVTIHHHLGVEQVSSEDGPGIYIGERRYQSLYPVPPLAPPIPDGSTLEKETQLWDIEVRMQDGSIRTVQQDFEPLFSVGARVLLDGDEIQLAQ